jgi:hypothetical protein
VLSPTVTLIPFLPRALTAARDFLQCPSVINTSEFMTHSFHIFEVLSTRILQQQSIATLFQQKMAAVLI